MPAELPFDDPTIDDLDADTRAAVARHWEHRGDSEERVAAIFTRFVPRLRDARAEAIVIELATRAADDELRHADICRAVASRYGDRAVGRAEREVTSVGVDNAAELEAAVGLAALCCIQETIACAWLQACRDGATARLPRAALRTLLEDETDHARLGWAHLASARVSRETREQIARHLPQLLEGCLQPWLVPDASGLPDGVAEHGIPADAETRRVVLGVVRDVVFPGFATVGVAPDAARRWLESQEQINSPLG